MESIMDESSSVTFTNPSSSTDSSRIFAKIAVLAHKSYEYDHFGNKTVSVLTAELSTNRKTLACLPWVYVGACAHAIFKMEKIIKFSSLWLHIMHGEHT